MYKILTLDDFEEWDKIVQGFHNYDAYYLSGYVKSLELIGDGQARMFYYDDNETKAINVFMKRDIGKCPEFRGQIEESRLFDIATPFGYGGFLIEGNGPDKVKDAYWDYCSKDHIVSEFVHFHPVLENWLGLEPFYSVENIGTTVCLDISNPDKIWNNFSRENRNRIRKAQKMGLRTYCGRSKEIKEIFKNIYEETMKHVHASDYYFFPDIYYECILDSLPNNALWFYTCYEEQVAAIVLFLLADGKMTYHLASSRKEFQSYAPTNLLVYDAALWGCANGFSTLHLGGGVSAMKDSLYRFKKTFNKQEDRTLCIGSKVYQQSMYDQLVEIRRQSKNFDDSRKFFPEYRK